MYPVGEGTCGGAFVLEVEEAGFESFQHNSLHVERKRGMTTRNHRVAEKSHPVSKSPTTIATRGQTEIFMSEVGQVRTMPIWRDPVSPQRVGSL